MSPLRVYKERRAWVWICRACHDCCLSTYRSHREALAAAWEHCGRAG